MSEPERGALSAASQDERNQMVREWVVETAGQFACEDRLGTDGRIYAAFWETASNAPAAAVDEGSTGAD